MSEQSKYDIAALRKTWSKTSISDEQIEEQSRLQAAFCEAYEEMHKFRGQHGYVGYKQGDVLRAAWRELQEYITRT